MVGHRSSRARLRRRVTIDLDLSYFDAYKNLAMTRDDNGVLTVRFHTDGGPIVFTGQTREDFPQALFGYHLLGS